MSHHARVLACIFHSPGRLAGPVPRVLVVQHQPPSRRGQVRVGLQAVQVAALDTLVNLQQKLVLLL